MNLCKFGRYCHRRFNFGTWWSLSVFTVIEDGMPCTGFCENWNTQLFIFIPANMDTNSAGFGFVCVPGTVVNPKSDGTAVATILDVDDPLSLISKDFTGGVVIVEVGLKKLCNYGRDVCYKTMVSRHQVHFLHQTHGIYKIIQHHRGYIFIDKSFIRLHFTPFWQLYFQ